MKNKYAKRSRISEAKIREIVRYVAADLTALQAAALSGLNRNTVNRLYRGACGSACCWPAKPSAGCLGSSRSTRASSGRGAYGKTVVFGIFERQGHVYTEIVPDCSTPTLQGIIRGRVDPRTVINSDGWRGYHGLVDLGYGHVRVDHARDEFTKGTVHINGIEGFWGLAKVRLTKFKGLPRHTFTSISRRPNGDTTIAAPTSTNACYSTYVRTRSARHDPLQKNAREARPLPWP